MFLMCIGAAIVVEIMFLPPLKPLPCCWRLVERQCDLSCQYLADWWSVACAATPTTRMTANTETETHGFYDHEDCH